MVRSAFLAAVAAASFLGCSAASGGDTSSTAAIVGGAPDSTFAAAGYLTFAEAEDAAAPACNATLIGPRVVVTAAHCVLRHPMSKWSFGVGEISDGRVTGVASIHVHPSFHADAESTVDLQHDLRLFDVAYLILDRDVVGVTPAAIASEAPHMRDDLHAVGYRADADGAVRREGAEATVVVSVDLAGDPIFEVHPDDGSALCIADGDEGSPVLAGTDSAPRLVGFFVGSVTQGLTDCVGGSQYLDGYESAYGYRAFYAEGIAAGAAAER